MARETADRCRTASELAENVEHWLDDEPVDAFREPWRERTYRWARKHKSAVVSGAAALALVLLVTGVATVVYLRERVNVASATIEPASVLKLQEALPNCTIVVKADVQQAIDKLRPKK